MKIAMLILITTSSFCQSEVITVKGRVLDAKTKTPLVNANIGLKNLPHGTASDTEGGFEFSIPNQFLNDTLFVSYVGYRAYANKLSNLDLSNVNIMLEESPTILDEITILEKRLYKLEIKKLEASMKLVKGNLYASKAEVTNDEYNNFLTYLLQSNQTSIYNKCKPEFSTYKGSLLAFFKGYHIPHLESKETKYDKNYDDYPIVNITHAAAKAYCEWLTNQYNNSSGKKKYKQVTFRLPGLKEWQIAALGYKKFQSWNLDENDVEVGIPENPSDEVSKKSRTIPVKGNDILYPWYGVYDYRNKAQNIKGCWLGNFKVPSDSKNCMVLRPGGDGYLITGKVATYFPNGMGLYDVVGNVAEMLEENGKACGGSWDHAPEESTIVSINNYSRASGAVGFRVFMDVIVDK